jgi:hypothetical protein
LEANTSPVTQATEIPPKKRKPRWKFLPYDSRSKQYPPIFRALLHELLQMPRSKFVELVNQDMPMSVVVAARLIHSAANGDMHAQMELMDRCDGKIPWQLDKTTTNVRETSATIRVVYEDPDDTATRRRDLADEGPKLLLPGEAK